ncbi:two-component system, response regulator YesN [Evansella caseinilytica]|uniref:Two-component system, response regulator YesN n=1 Tax=Evansella caseinilytica TaxID=1503961 RepID=A0A1H3U3M9_9BACI|nr:response regulator transcription factor [Evansella caseinilytica]SDZ57084.1 two-component system, response regulator YesN [Evansella caseinilytica]
MLKVMLVDDEPLILEGLKNIIDWEAFGFQVAATARNGLEALEKSRKMSFDVLITDIKMPEMTGLQLIRYLREEQKKTKVIVLSGFQEFGLVKEGLQLGIENYLLKPIKEEELISSLQLVKEKMNRAVLEEESAFVLRDHAIWRWVAGKMSYEALRQRMSFYPELQVAAPLWMGLLKVEVDEQNGEAWQIWRKTFERQGSTVTVITPAGDFLFLWLKESPERWEAEMGKLRRLMNSTKKTEDYVFVHSKKIADLSEIQDVYRELEMASELKMLLPEKDHPLAEQLYSASEGDKQSKRYSNNYVSHELMEQLANQHYEAVKSSMKHTLSQFERERPLLMKSVLLEFFFQVKNKFSLHIDYEMYVETLQKILSIEELTDALGLVDKCIEMMDMNYSKQDQEYSPIIQTVLNFIHQNLPEEMSLKTLGNSFHINPIYLGQLFQKEVNCSFTKYLNKLRIEKAKKLLLHSYEKAGAIGKKVGYTDAAYFYKQFKKLEGVTPSEWRKEKQ